MALNTSTDRTGQSTRESKFYELSNHLGNVLATVSDMKLGYTTTRGQTSAQGYKAQVQSASDYFPFGWAMSGRQYSAGEYRYGFNGKENDTHWGDQLIQDYGFRLYNPAVAKFLSVDPLAPEYPELTPYQFASNHPIDGIDIDGLEFGPATQLAEELLFGTCYLKKTNEAVTDAVTMPIRAAATGVHAVGAGVTHIPAYAFGDFSSTPIYYDYMNFRWNRGGSVQSEQTMNQMSWVAIEEGAGAAVGGILGKGFSAYMSVRRARKAAIDLGGFSKFGGVHNKYDKIAADSFRTGVESIRAGSKSIDNVVVTREGIDNIIQHLSNDYFTEGGPLNKGNKVMIDRLEGILSDGKQATDTDMYFYTDETYKRFHAQTSKEYGVKPLDEENTFYTPEAIDVLWQ